MAVSFTLSDAATVLSGFTSLVAVGIAARALRHNRQAAREEEVTNTAVADAETNVILREYGEKFVRAFKEISDSNERFRQHDKDCAAEKARTQQQQLQTAKILERLEERLDKQDSRLSSVTRSVGYLAEKDADQRTAERLGWAERHTGENKP